MKKKTVPLLLIFILVGVIIMCSCNTNNRSHYKIYEKNGEYYYEDSFSGNKMTLLSFSDGLALIQEYETTGKAIHVGLNIWKYINQQGEVVLQPDVYLADAFSEGLAAVMPGEGSYWGYINKDGEMVIEPQFRQASMFKDGYASVYIENDGNIGTWILIDKKGEYIRDLDEPLD